MRILPFRRHGRWGYIDGESKVVKDATFRWAGYFHGQKAVVVDGVCNCIIDASFQVCTRFPPGLDIDEAFSDGLAVACHNNERWFYVDEQGKDVFHMSFDLAFPFVDGVAFVKHGARWGLISRDGRWLKHPAWRNVHRFIKGQGKTSVQIEDSRKWIFIDSEGERIGRSDFDSLGGVVDEIAPYGYNTKRGMKYGLVRLTGEVLVPAQFESCEQTVSDKTLGVEYDDGAWGVIDIEGKSLIPPSYLYAGQYSEGFFVVYSGGRRDLNNHVGGGKYGFISRANECLCGFQFDLADPFKDGVSRVHWRPPGVSDPSEEVDFSDMFMGYVDTAGRILWKEQ